MTRPQLPCPPGPEPLSVPAGFPSHASHSVLLADSRSPHGDFKSALAGAQEKVAHPPGSGRAASCEVLFLVLCLAVYSSAFWGHPPVPSFISSEDHGDLGIACVNERANNRQRKKGPRRQERGDRERSEWPRQGYPGPCELKPVSTPSGGSDPAGRLVRSLDRSRSECVIVLHVTVICPHCMAPPCHPPCVTGAQLQRQRSAPTAEWTASLALHVCTRVSKDAQRYFRLFLSMLK